LRCARCRRAHGCWRGDRLARRGMAYSETWRVADRPVPGGPRSPWPDCAPPSSSRVSLSLRWPRPGRRGAACDRDVRRLRARATAPRWPSRGGHDDPHQHDCYSHQHAGPASRRLTEARASRLDANRWPRPFLTRAGHHLRRGELVKQVGRRQGAVLAARINKRGSRACGVHASYAELGPHHASQSWRQPRPKGSFARSSRGRPGHALGRMQLPIQTES
jgi:hypothetical protein